MTRSQQDFSCACGAVSVDLAGAPILAVTCHCDDCQAAAATFLSAGRPDITDGTGGTPYLLYRADRLQVARGAEGLEPFRLEPESATRRQVASCCGTPMFVDFDRGPHWVSVYRNSLPESAPEIEMRVQVRFAPDREALPKDVPVYDSASPGFVWRLVKARIAMLFG